MNDAANKIAVSAERSADRFQAPGRDLDARQALEYMRDTLRGTCQPRVHPSTVYDPTPDLAAGHLEQVSSVKQRVPASHAVLIREGIGAGSFE